MSHSRDPRSDEVSEYLETRMTDKDVCLVVMSNFNAPWEYPNALDPAIRNLRNNHIRLCIVAFDNPPYPPLAQYVQESGGVVIYPQDGTPIPVLAAKLAAALPPLTQ